jgi:hypothetical protein
VNNKIDYYLYITLLIDLMTSSLFGNHSASRTGEYGAGVSAVFIFSIGASK